MPAIQLTLTAEERDYLTTLLESVLKDKRIEEHRTRTLSYRPGIIHEEDVLKSLLGKLALPEAKRQ